MVVVVVEIPTVGFQMVVLHQLDQVVEQLGVVLVDPVDRWVIMVVMVFQQIRENMVLAVAVVPVELVLMVMLLMVDLVVLVFKCQQHSMIQHQQ
tara:strand:+ start:257 stop:538 length:282 start_codon:yes stop_codon:yes gene_type:complete